MAVLGYWLLGIGGRFFIRNPPSLISLSDLRGFAVNIFGWGEVGMPARDAPATDWGETPNTVNFRKIRVDQANRSETSTEDTDTTENTDFQLFTVLSVDFSLSVVHHPRTCQTVRLRPILTALGETPKPRGSHALTSAVS